MHYDEVEAEMQWDSVLLELTALQQNANISAAESVRA